MFGATESATMALLWISWGACVTDCWTGKIYNAWTFPSLIGGLAFALLSPETGSFWNACGGVCLSFFLFGIPFYLHILGAGDVKCLMALGAWVGWKEALELGLVSFLGGFVLALIALIHSRRSLLFLYRLQEGLSLKRFSFGAEAQTQTLPFGPAIALGAWVGHFFHPLQKWIF